MHADSDAESRIAADLRTIAVDHIAQSDLGDADVGAKLGVARETAHALLQRPTWNVALAMRVVDQLGLQVRVDRG